MKVWLKNWSHLLVFFVVVIITIVGGSSIVDSTPSSVVATSAPAKHTWTKADSLAYAHDQVIEDAQAQFACLSNLWGKESAWDAKAHNKIRVMGKTAGGIPQLLGMSPLVPPTIQIERGLSYIYFRYGTVCNAWKHWQQKGWY